MLNDKVSRHLFKYFQYLVFIFLMNYPEISNKTKILKWNISTFPDEARQLFPGIFCWCQQQWPDTVLNCELTPEITETFALHGWNIIITMTQCRVSLVCLQSEWCTPEIQMKDHHVADLCHKDTTQGTQRPLLGVWRWKEFRCVFLAWGLYDRSFMCIGHGPLIMQ